MNQILFWILFNVFVVAMLALDLGFFHRRTQQPTLRQSLVWSALWIFLAVVFAVLIYAWQGQGAALDFSTGYIIELSLSADNLFIFLLIFRFFRLPEHEQYRVLFWGIIGAIVMRAAFIFAGVSLIRKFHWIIYAFGFLLVYSGIRLLSQRGARVDPHKNPVMRVFQRMVPVTEEYSGKFFLRREKLYATPLLLVLVVIETTDLIFAVDSIPAVLAITQNPFIVYTSNILAILGLRSLFFALSPLMDIFEYLHYGISCVLVFVGIKMLLSHYYPIRTEISLAVIGGILLATIVASALHRNAPAH